MIIIVKGAGDIASGVIETLYTSGFKVLALETEKPSSIRRTVSFSECIYRYEVEIENIKAKKVKTLEEIEMCWKKEIIPVVVDPCGKWIEKIKPEVVIDAILAKKNIGMKCRIAPLTIGLGPGFIAKIDVDFVIETMRGHCLGRVIEEGSAQENTGIPGEIKGFSKERVIYSNNEGKIEVIKDIASKVKKGDTIAIVNGVEVKSKIDGIVRGMIPNGYFVTKNFKIADIDPREEELENCYLISDKARTLGGAVLKIILLYLREKRKKENGNRYIEKNI